MPFNSLLSEKTARLTGAQQRALKYITENYEDAVFLTASSLSRRIGVSEATIVRLAQALGFHGFRGMQKMLRKNFQNRLSTDARLEQTVKHAKTDEDILVKLCRKTFSIFLKPSSPFQSRPFIRQLQKWQPPGRFLLSD